jgi:hypothetical protein
VNESLSDIIETDIAEMRFWRVRSEIQWGEINQKLGTFVKDFIAPKIPEISSEVFHAGGAADFLFSAPNLRLRHPIDPSRLRAFEFIYATTNGWIVVASSEDPKLKDVDAFRELLADIKEYFPQFVELPLYPIFSSLYVPDQVSKYCSRHGIYALGMGSETMEILNLAGLQTSL